MRKALLLSISLSFFSTVLLADTTLESPLYLDDGKAEFSIGQAYFEDRISFDTQTTAKSLSNGPIFGMKFGFGDRAEFEMKWDTYRKIKTDRDGSFSDVGDLYFFTKIGLLSERKWPSATFRIGAKLPNSSKYKRTGSDLADTYLWLLSGKQVGAFYVSGVFGLEILGRSVGGQFDLLRYGGAVSYSLIESLQVRLQYSERFNIARDHFSPVDQEWISAGLGWKNKSGWSAQLDVSKGLIDFSESIGTSLSISKVMKLF